MDSAFNQRDVREMPHPLPHKEVDPLSSKPRKYNEAVPKEGKPLPEEPTKLFLKTKNPPSLS